MNAIFLLSFFFSHPPNHNTCAARGTPMFEIRERTDTQPSTATTRIYAADGEQLASYALEQRVVLRPEEIPDHFKLAVVAIEDADFYSHGDVDPQAILRAAWYSLLDRRIGSRGGASTLTQQLALNLFLKRERTYQR